VRRIANKVLRPLGYELKKRRDSSFDRVAVGQSFVQYFNMTEGAISLKEGSLLYDLARGVQGACILEVGSYRGRSAVALGRGSLDGHRAPVFAIDPHEEFTGVMGGRYGPPDRGAFYKAMIDTSCYHVVRLINLSSELVAPNWKEKIGLLWIDGDHSYAGVKRDFEAWQPHLTPTAWVAFDDSTNPEIGPYRLIRELLATGRFEQTHAEGKVTVLRAKP